MNLKKINFFWGRTLKKQFFLRANLKKIIFLLRYPHVILGYSETSFCQKTSGRDDFFKTVETRRKFTLKSLYFWNRVSTVLQKSSQLDFFLKFSDRVKSLSESYSRIVRQWGSQLCMCRAVLGTWHSADHDCDIVQRRLHVLISGVPLKLHLFCEFLRPLVSEFDGGSEFLTRNWFWECPFIHLIITHISRDQVM